MGKSNAAKDRESNERIQQKNRESQELINSQNLDFQRENLDYLRATQQKQWEREDSSYQRTVADMRAVGLSPLTMQGTNGSGDLLQTDALNAGQAYQEQGLYNRQQDFVNKINAVQQITDSFSNVFKNISDIKKTQAETQAISDNNRLNNETYNDRRDLIRSQAISARYDNLSKREKQAYNSFFGINDNMSQSERLLHIYARLSDVPLNDYSGTASSMRQGVENISKEISNFTDYSSPRKMSEKDIDTLVNNLSQGLGKAFSSISDTVNPASSVIDAVENLTSETSSSHLKEDERIRKKAEKGEKLNAWESLIYLLNKNGVK